MNIFVSFVFITKGFIILFLLFIDFIFNRIKCFLCLIELSSFGGNYYPFLVIGANLGSSRII